MPRQLKAIGFILVLLLGVYGCAKGPGSAAVADTSGHSTKVKQLEEDYRAAAAARDQFRKKLVYAEEQQARIQKELERTRAQAESLKGEVKTRVAERDALQVQYEAFRKNLKDLLGKADTAVGSLNLPAPKPSADQRAGK